MKKLRTKVAYLILTVGTFYLAQLWIQGIAPHLLVGAVMGLAYMLIGLGLLGTSMPSLWLGCFLPLLSIVTSIHRYLTVIDDTIILVNIGLNLPILLGCSYLLYQNYKKS
jgi:hypothetical protein